MVLLSGTWNIPMRTEKPRTNFRATIPDHKVKYSPATFVRTKVLAFHACRIRVDIEMEIPKGNK